MHTLLQSNMPGLFDLISSELGDRIRNLGKSVTYHHGEMLHTRGDEKPGMTIVKSGTVLIGNFGKDGSFLTTAIFGPGQCFGEFTLFAGLPRTHHITAEGICCVQQIPGQVFMQVFNQEPELAKALLSLSLIRSHQLLETLDDLRRLPLPVQVTKFLLSLTDRENGPADIRCRQEDIAFTFGISRVSTGKILKKIEKAGLIQLGYGKIHLTDISAVKHWVEERNSILPVSSSLNMRRSRQ